MAASIERDSKGRYWYLIRQTFGTSCGPASVAMVESAYKQQCMAADPEVRAMVISQKYPGSWDGISGTLVTNLSYILNEEGVQAYAGSFVGPSAIGGYLRHYARPNTPAIVHIAWSSTQGHFAVCPIVDPDGTAIFLDPFAGLYETNVSNLPLYNNSAGSGQLSGWLVITHR